jgi:hypothetical protein
MLLDGEPRIMTHAEGEGHSLLIRPVALKPGEHKVVSQRLYEIFRAAPAGRKAKPAPAAPAFDLSGTWDVTIQYDVGSAAHKLFLVAKGNQVSGSHAGWAYQGDLRGKVDGDKVELRSGLQAEGSRLTYTFTGTVAGDSISGTVGLGEYGKARWEARRHSG